MDNKDIHNGLDKKEIRDFLSSKLEESKISSSVKQIEKEIMELQSQLKMAKIKEATIELIKLCNWKYHDVSDLVPYNEKEYFDFIGTDEEFEELENKIKKIK